VESRQIDLLRCAVYRPQPREGARQFRTVVARVPGRPASWYAPIREAIQAADSRLRVRSVTALGPTLDLIGSAEAERGLPFLALQLGFCALALLLAAVGVFGVMGQLGDERRAE